MFTLTVSDEPVTTFKDSCDQWEQGASLTDLVKLTETSTFKVYAGLDGQYKFWQIWRGNDLQLSGRIFRE